MSAAKKRQKTGPRVRGRGRLGLAEDDARAIGDRLREYFLASKRVPSQSALARHLGRVPGATLSGWLRRKRPHPPELANVIHWARTLSLSPSWLLIGDKPELRNTARSDAALSGDLRARLASDLAAKVQGTVEEVEGILPTADELYEQTLERWFIEVRREIVRLRERRRERAWKQARAHWNESRTSPLKAEVLRLFAPQYVQLMEQEDERERERERSRRISGNLREGQPPRDLPAIAALTGPEEPQKVCLR